MESLPESVKYNNEIFTACEVGHEIKVGDLLVMESPYGVKAFPFVRIGKIYAFAKLNQFATDRYPLVYTEPFTPSAVHMTKNVYRVYQKQQ